MSVRRERAEDGDDGTGTDVSKEVRRSSFRKGEFDVRVNHLAPILSS